MRLTHLIGLFSVGAGVAASAVACSSDPDETADPTATSTSAGGTSTVGPGPGPGTGGTGTGGMPDESTSCDDAVEMQPDMNGVFSADGVINPAGDTDFFKFTADAGQWFAIFTDANPDDIPEMIDTVVTLYNADGSTQLAEVDDSYPRYSTDTELFHRFVDGGTYCLKVQEFTTWSGEPDEGGPDYTYTISALHADPSVFLGYTYDTEPNDTVGEAQAEPHNYTTDMMSGQVFTRLMGMLDPGTDVDVYQFTTPPGAVAINLDLTPWGNVLDGQGYGSTGGPGTLSLIDGATGLVTLARVDNQLLVDGLDSMYLPVDENTDYYLQVEKPAGSSLGANDFYVLKYGTRAELNPQEMNDPGNSNVMGAEQTVGTPDGTVVRHFIGGELTAFDEDIWKFDPANFPQSGEELILVCSSRSVGSGVQDMTVTFEDVSGQTPTKTQVEDPAKGVFWSTADGATDTSIVLQNGGAGAEDELLIRISATTVDPTVLSTHYLCGIHVGTF